jgi:hypothetical protein
MMTFVDALNYFGLVFGLVFGMGCAVWFMALVGERFARSRCRYRHPASVGRRARIVEQRRAAIDQRSK